MRKINVNSSYYRLIVLLLLSWSFSLLSAQNVTVSGVVSDDMGTIPGVTVQVKGQAGGTITDIDGKYTIQAASGDVLVFAFMGMETQEVAFTGQLPLNVTMTTGAIAVEELVVVGFGAQKKESVVGSIVTAGSEEIMQAGSVTSVSQALAGILPGVSVMQDAGMPGATDANILIRGMSTWTDNTPLYLVDGVERDFNSIDPNEIESISVLKDASATAVYGVKAANGVILVTTKKGANEKVRVNASANFGIKNPTVRNDHATEYSEVLEYYNQAALNEYNYGALYKQSLIDAWADPNRDMDYYSYVFLSDMMIDKGYTQQYNINVSGGNKFVKYFTSLGYTYDGDMFDVEEQDDFDPRTYTKRYNWRSNLDFNLTKTTKFGVKLSGDFNDWNGNKVTNSVPTGADANWTSASFTSIFNTPQIGTPPVLSDGRLGFPTGGSGSNTPYGLMTSEGQYQTRTTRVYSDFLLEQDITKHLKFVAKMSLNYTRQYKNSLLLNEIYFEADPSLGTITQVGDPDAYASLPVQSSEWINTYRQTLYYDGRLSYTRTFADAHDVHLLGLFSRREDNQKLEFARREESWVARATYAYKSRYMFEFNGAYNGNENWAPGMKYGFFPSGAIGWNVSEEAFMKNNLPGINFLKLKYSVGLVGSDSGIGSDRFTYIQSYSQMDNVYWGWDAAGNSDYITYMEGSPANAENTWEESLKQNIGLEFRILDSKLKTEFDLYDEKRSGIIMQRNTIPEMLYGNTAPKANLGETKTHGFDLSVTYNGIVNEDLSYYVTGNLAMSENRVVFRDDLPNADEYKQSAGKPIGYNTAMQTTGFLESWDDVFNSTPAENAGTLVIPGDYGVLDYNSDGIINNDDLIPMKYPTYASNSFAFTLGVQYKNFSLHGMFNGVFNIAKTIPTNYYYSMKEGDGVLNGHERDYWTSDNLDAQSISPRLTGWYIRTDNMVLNSSFLRLRNLELKYNLADRTLDRMKYFSKVELYVNAQNLMTWTSLPESFDPESKTLISYPLSRTYNMGCRISF